MNNILDIFYNNVDADTENIMKNVPIKWNDHAKGIINIGTALNNGEQYIVNEQNKKVLKLLLQYFTGNNCFESDFETYTGTKGSLSKGLYIVGDVGCGKTLLMKIFKQYTMNILQQNSFVPVNEIDIINLIANNGAGAIEEFGYNHGTPKTLYIDDFASQNAKVKHFGTDIDVINQLLTLRYVVFTRYRKLTHVSTNVFPRKLTEIFDNRLVDRLTEMFNVLELPGNSLRK